MQLKARKSTELGDYEWWFTFSVARFVINSLSSMKYYVPSLDSFNHRLKLSASRAFYSTIHGTLMKDLGLSDLVARCMNSNDFKIHVFFKVNND